MRGKAVPSSAAATVSRITPAYAGKRSCFVPKGQILGDHPRICGEKFCRPFCPALRSGSPPHMRGKATRTGKRSKKIRITPAYAGKSQWAGGLVVSIGDHPRICGEKRGAPVSLIRSAGSPPHMRGKVGLLLLLRSRSWITPAYAGKSFIVRCSALEVKDHPRICGEKFNALPAELKAKGSPPHMRGKVGLKETQSSASRITPAYAGKSWTPRPPSARRGDHPRICGEKDIQGELDARAKGSPPHMRGKGQGCRSGR